MSAVCPTFFIGKSKIYYHNYIVTNHAELHDFNYRLKRTRVNYKFTNTLTKLQTSPNNHAKLRRTTTPHYAEQGTRQSVATRKMQAKFPREHRPLITVIVSNNRSMTVFFTIIFFTIHIKHYSITFY